VLDGYAASGRAYREVVIADTGQWSAPGSPAWFLGALLGTLGST